MKKLLPLLLLFSLGTGVAHAAPSIAVKTQSTSFLASNAEGILLSGKNVLYFSNVVNINNDIVVTALDSSNQLLWSRTIDSGGDEVATAGTSDAAGNIWIAGALAPVFHAETSTPQSAIDNPDQVVVDNPSRLRPDMTSLALWKLAPTGEILATWQLEIGAVALVNSVSANSTGVSVVGALNGKPFLISATNTGVFGKILYIGSEKTSVSDVIRNSDGTINLYGSSSETLLKKKVAGKRDGILVTVSKGGVITQLVRSSAPQAIREWQSAASTNVVTGSVITGKSVETAITQFTKTFTPTWTLRIASTGQSRVTTLNGLTFVALTSKAAISGISGWKPATPTLLVISFDSKGVMKGAYSFPGLNTPIALIATRDGGVVGAAVGSDSSVSIFRLGSR